MRQSAPRSRVTAVSSLLVLAALLSLPVRLSAEGGVDFGRQIRPILADSCFHCHGPAEETRKAKFRLDTREGAFADIGGGFAIVPGKPDESELLHRITATDDDVMPPADSGKKRLTPEQVELVRRWIAEGAEWHEHWSFLAPVRPAVPDVMRADWAAGPIDRFVAARREREGLAPAPAADRRTLIRRVTFDLTGLPPDSADVEAFVNDTDPDAYEKVVDRLLDSEHYGEHMGRFWLDAARYGDTHGLHLDNYREMWPYRDWVIDAFNDNMPFDRFVVEQLAGDLLPNATLEQKIASGFNRCHVTTSEGGSIAEEVYVRNVTDRVETTGTVFLGLTLGCAVCHSHKYDPIAQKEFYQLFAFFNNMDGNPLDGNAKDPAPVAKVPSEDQAQELASLDEEVAAAEAELAGPLPDVDAAQLAWAEQRRRGEGVAWEVVDVEEFVSRGGAALEKLPDRSILASGPNPDREVYEFQTTLSKSHLTAIRLEGLTHETLTEKGVGRSENSNVVLTEFEAEVAPAGGPDTFHRVSFSRAWADHEQPDGDFKVANAIDGKPGTGWAVEGHKRREPRTAIFLAEHPFGFDVGTRLRVRLRHESVFGKHQFGRVRLAVTDASDVPMSKDDEVPAAIQAVLDLEPEKRTDAQQLELRTYYREKVSTHATLAALKQRRDDARKRRDELQKSIPTTLIMKERGDQRPAYLLIRGAYDRRGEQVERRTPVALPPMDESLPRNRLGFAKWLVDPSHPLLARVTVNRFWQQYFGIGLVKTAEDFGSQGEPPSHPELLDWLAVEFRESGWDVKRLQKRIVMSSTYRQSSRVTPELAARDPENRLLARGPRFRLDAEMLRDQALALSGSLVRTLGGPSVKPPQPDGLWYAVGYTSSNTARFKADTGDRIYRRSVYTFWKRTAPPPQMNTFDAPSRESCTVRRERTNTPLQALLLMNDPQYVEAARRFAERVLREGGDSVESRAAWAFRLATARPPTADELAVLVEVFQGHLADFRADAAAAKRLNDVGESKPGEGLDPVELAAWSMLTNLILNLDEVITKE